MCFLKSVKIQLVEMLIQPIVLHLVDFEKDFKSLTLFDLAVKPIEPFQKFNWLFFWKP